MKMSFILSHVQKFRLHDVIVGVMFWQPVPVHTPKAKNCFLSNSENHIPDGLSVVTTGGSVGLTASVKRVPETHTVYCK